MRNGLTKLLGGINKRKVYL